MPYEHFSSDQLDRLTQDILRSYENDVGTNFIDAKNLPVREKILYILDSLMELLFPGYTGNRLITSDNIRSVVQEILITMRRELAVQIELALRFNCELKDCPACDCRDLAHEFSQKILDKIPYLRSMLKDDVQAAYDGDPAAKAPEEVVLSYPYLIALAIHRIAHELYLLDIPLIPRMMAEHAHSQTGVDVVYSCIPDAAYPWDPVVMRMIQEFAPDAVPMWIHWVFLSPHATGNPQITVLGRHALGRRIRNLTSELEPFRCAMPTMPCQGLSFEQPNRIWFIHEGSRDQRAADLPGTFLPFDSSILDRARRNAIGFRMTEKEFAAHMREEFIENERQARELRRKRLSEDMEYRQQDFERYARRQPDKVSEAEARDYVDAKNRGFIEEPKKIAVVVP